MAAAGIKRRVRGQPSRPPRPWLAPLLGFVLAAGALAGAYDYLSRPGRLPLNVVEVSGEFRRLDPAAIQRTVVGAIDGGFFSCDMARLRRAVLAMPWVEDVSIRRRWPDRLDMRVTEQVPLARWGDDALISVSAEVFRPHALEGFDGLVRLSGPAGSEQRVVDFFATALALARTRGLRLTAVDLDQRRHWWMRFSDGLTVSLGREDVERRLTQFLRVYPSLMAHAGRQPARVDMRYAHGFAVRWRQASPADDVAVEIDQPQGNV